MQDRMPCDNAAVLPEHLGCRADLIICRSGCEFAERPGTIFCVSIFIADGIRFDHKQKHAPYIGTSGSPDRRRTPTIQNWLDNCGSTANW